MWSGRPSRDTARPLPALQPQPEAAADLAEEETAVREKLVLLAAPPQAPDEAVHERVVNEECLRVAAEAHHEAQGIQKDPTW